MAKQASSRKTPERSSATIEETKANKSKADASAGDINATLNDLNEKCKIGDCAFTVNLAKEIRGQGSKAFGYRHRTTRREIGTIWTKRRGR